MKIITCFSPKRLSLLVFVLVGLLAKAQRNLIIPIESAHNSIVLQVGADQRVGTIYFGSKLKDTSEYRLVQRMYRRGDDYSGILNSAYTPAGSRNLVEPAIEVTHANGNTSLDLQYVSHTTTKTDNNVSVIAVLLRDPVYAFDVTLFYKVYFNEDVVEQWTVIKNREKGSVTMAKYASANLYMTAKNYWLKHYHGDWAKEMRPEEIQLTAGIKVLDTKLGTRAHLYQPPSFMVSLDKPATEDEGKVVLGTLAWSGNFKVDLEVDPLNNLRLIAGINPFASAYTLK
ncbi:MAG TPA: glycoside hydrolase family 36 N-terminal domain-containing protein, partial [Segetibacter sp.]